MKYQKSTDDNQANNTQYSTSISENIDTIIDNDTLEEEYADLSYYQESGQYEDDLAENVFDNEIEYYTEPQDIVEYQNYDDDMLYYKNNLNSNEQNYYDKESQYYNAPEIYYEQDYYRTNADESSLENYSQYEYNEYSEHNEEEYSINKDEDNYSYYPERDEYYDDNNVIDNYLYSDNQQSYSEDYDETYYDISGAYYEDEQKQDGKNEQHPVFDQPMDALAMLAQGIPLSSNDFINAQINQYNEEIHQKVFDENEDVPGESDNEIESKDVIFENQENKNLTKIKTPKKEIFAIIGVCVLTCAIFIPSTLLLSTHFIANGQQSHENENKVSINVNSNKNTDKVRPSSNSEILSDNSVFPFNTNSSDEINTNIPITPEVPVPEQVPEVSVTPQTPEVIEPIPEELSQEQPPIIEPLPEENPPELTEPSINDGNSIIIESDPNAGTIEQEPVPEEPIEILSEVDADPYVSQELIEQQNTMSMDPIRYVESNQKVIDSPDEPQWVTIGDWNYVTADTFAALPNYLKIELIGRMAQDDMKITNILASVTIAQCILESGWMESGLAQYNNMFGIKTSSPGNNWSGSTWNGSYVTMRTGEEYTEGEITYIYADFRAYPNVWHSVRDHSMYLRNAMKGDVRRYEGIIGERDPLRAITIIKNGGYATSSTYIDSIMDIINRYNLTKYDQI